MVVFREKEFVAPLIAGGLKLLGSMGAMTGISAVQGRQANKIAQQQGAEQIRIANSQARQQMAEAKKQTELMAKQTKAYQQAAQSAAKNGALVQSPAQMQQQTFSITLKRKTFANPVVQGITKLANKAATSKAWTKFKGSKTGSNIIGFGKDLIEVGKKRGSAQKIADMTAMGATMAGGGYLVDKAIQADAKKSGIPIEPGQQPQEKKKSGVVKKAILGTGAAAGTLLLARKGKLNAQTFKKGSKMLGEGFKNQFRLKDPNTGQKNILGPVLTIGFPAMAGVSYLTQKKQMKDQIEQSERQYSNAFVRNLGKRIALGKRKLVDAPAALMGFGRTNRKRLGNQLLSQAKTSGNPITQKMGELVNPKNALLGTAAGIGIGSLAFKPFDLGDKAVRKPLEKVDKKAYGYEKSQNQVV